MSGSIFQALIAIGLIWFLIRSRQKKRQREVDEREGFLSRIGAAQEWASDLENLPVITETRLSLQAGERCFYYGPAEWWEFRKRTKRVTYHGPVASVKLMKGVRYRVGSIAPSIESQTELIQIDTGTLYITNKRLFFDGREKNSTLTWRTVAGIAAFNGGFEVEKHSGKSPHLLLNAEPERAAAIATMALQGRAE